MMPASYYERSPFGDCAKFSLQAFSLWFSARDLKYDRGGFCKSQNQLSWEHAFVMAWRSGSGGSYKPSFKASFPHLWLCMTGRYSQMHRSRDFHPNLNPSFSESEM